MAYKRGPYKEFCKRGHPLADALVEIRANGNLRRTCRGCQRARRRERFGPPKARRMRPLAERFWPKVERGDGCWLWQGATQSDGRYGSISAGRAGRPPLRAHRVSWELHFGPIPDALVVCHRCDVPLCVRPDHLFLGTQADNMADMARKGRSGAVNSH